MPSNKPTAVEPAAEPAETPAADPTPAEKRQALQGALDWYQKEPESWHQEQESWRTFYLNGRPYSVCISKALHLTLHAEERDAEGFLQTQPDPPLAEVFVPDEPGFRISPGQVEYPPPF